MKLSGQEKLKYIAEHYMKLMLSRAYSVLSDPVEAEDACQEAFLRIIKYIDKIDDVTEMRTAALCGMIAKNAAVDLYRKRSRMVPAAEVFTDPDGSAGGSGEEPAVSGQQGEGRKRGAPDQDEPYERLEQKEAVERLKGLIEELPENYRDVLRLRCLNGLSAADTAELLNISENTVNIRLTRARKALKEKLAGEHPPDK